MLGKNKRDLNFYIAMTMGSTDYENMKAELEQSYRAMVNHRATFPSQKPSSLEKRLEIIETSPNISGAIKCVLQEQNNIESSLPPEWHNHFKPFLFPRDQQWIQGNTGYGPPRQQPVKGMVHINNHTRKKNVYFNFLRASCTFDEPGLILYVETEQGSCRDLQIIFNDNGIDILALREEMHQDEACSCYVLRRYSKTIHLPHAIEHEKASFEQEGNTMCVFIPWKSEE